MLGNDVFHENLLRSMAITVGDDMYRCHTRLFSDSAPRIAIPMQKNQRTLGHRQTAENYSYANGHNAHTAFGSKVCTHTHRSTKCTPTCTMLINPWTDVVLKKFIKSNFTLPPILSLFLFAPTETTSGERTLAVAAEVPEPELSV